MTSFDMLWFQQINATPETARWVIDSALFVSRTLPALAGALLVVGLLRPSARQASLFALLSIALGWCLVHAIQSAIPLPRPAALGLGMQWIPQGPRPGFPSMHSTATFALACALWVRASRWALPAMGLGLLMGWSRVCLGLHFPSDVLAGALVGAVAAMAMAWAVHGLQKLSDAVLVSITPWPLMGAKTSDAPEL